MGVNTVLASGGAFTAPTQATGYPDETVPRTLGKPPLLDSEVGEKALLTRFWISHSGHRELAQNDSPGFGSATR